MPEQDESHEQRPEASRSSRWSVADAGMSDSEKAPAAKAAPTDKDDHYGPGARGPQRSGARTDIGGRGAGAQSSGSSARSADRTERPRGAQTRDAGRGAPSHRAVRGDDRPDRRDRGPRSWELNAPGRDTDRARIREPELPEGITGKELDRQVWTQLRTLSKDNAQGVARHLVAAAQALDDDVDLALEHAEHAAKRAGRVAAVREALGLVRYRRAEFSDALREFRTARRLSGSNHLLAYMVDCERGLGRPDRAMELAGSAEAKDLAEGDNIELAIVVSGVRRDLGQPEAAVMCLRIPALNKATDQPWAARLYYAYADALLATGDEDGSREWFLKALDADVDEQTDAAVRLGLASDIEMTDLLAGDDDPDIDHPDRE